MTFILFLVAVGQGFVIRKLYQENKWLTGLLRKPNAN